MPTAARGKLVILLILALAAAMGTYSWWHHYQAGRRSAKFWGAETAVLVRYGEEVWYIPLQEIDGQPESQPASSGDSISIQGKQFRVGEPVDVAQGRGMVHARHALVDDLSFDWGAEQPSAARWKFLLRFHDQGQTATVAFAPESGTVRYLDQDRQLMLVPKITDAFRKKFDEWETQASGVAPARR